MKILSFFILISITMFSAWGNSGESGIITMTTSAECFSFWLIGSGVAIVDWGDGSKKDTVKLVLADEYRRSWVRRTDLDTIPRTITITGKNITGLDCDAKFHILDINRVRPECNQITALDVSRNATLTYLDCGKNKLTELDISKNAALLELRCDNNQLTELDVSKNTVLTRLSCGDNSLTKLDVSRNTALTGLFCEKNQLTALNVSRNTALMVFSCNDNQLTALDVSRNTVLKFFKCTSNQLTTNVLNLLFGTLHSNTVMDGFLDEGEQIATKTIYISDNPGSADCDRSIAEAKGWKVSYAED